MQLAEPVPGDGGLMLGTGVALVVLPPVLRPVGGEIDHHAVAGDLGEHTRRCHR